jgi:hypothetical protein
MEKIINYTQLKNENPTDRVLLLYETLHYGAEVFSEIIHRISGYEIGYWELIDMTAQLIEERDREQKRVRIPTDENEAFLMAVLGMNWLEQNAPHRLKKVKEAE